MPTERLDLRDGVSRFFRLAAAQVDERRDRRGARLEWNR